MGVMAAVLGGALLGVGMASKMGKQKKEVDYGQVNQAFNNTVSTVPQAPQIPILPTDNGNQKSNDMLLAEEEERKRRLAEAEANKTNHTSGLGVTGDAAIGRKTLLG